MKTNDNINKNACLSPNIKHSNLKSSYKNNIDNSLKKSSKLTILEDNVYISKLDVYNMMNQNKLENISKDYIDKMFDELDINKSNKIRKSVMLNYISNNKYLDKTSIKDNIEHQFLSESEIIINKLLDLKQLLLNLSELKAVENVEYIINTITNVNLDQYNISDKYSDNNNTKNNSEIDALKLYSKVELNNQINLDIKKVTVNYKSTNSRVNQFTSSRSNKNISFVQDINSKTNTSNLDASNVSIKYDEKKKTNKTRKSYFSNKSEVLNTEESNIQLNSNYNVVNNYTLTKIDECLNLVEDFDFDIFKFENIAKKDSLLYCAYNIFDVLNLFEDIIPEKAFNEFIKSITNGYDRNIAYHNDIHALDVLQTTYVILEKGSFYYKLELSELDYVSILLSAICHDYKHPGFGNSYLINSFHNLAVNFNDYSPLENMHISETFKLINSSKNNIFINLNSSEFRLLRKRMIESVLSTDMSNHSKYLTALKNKITFCQIKEGKDVNKLIEDSNSIKKFDNQQLVLNNIIHAADISNPAKLSHIYRKWVDLIFLEFFNQGDLEKKENLNVTILCDRETTDINKSQIGFIKFVVKPTFETLLILAPEIQTYIEYINRNCKMYEELAAAIDGSNVNENNKINAK